MKAISGHLMNVRFGSTTAICGPTSLTGQKRTLGKLGRLSAFDWFLPLAARMLGRRLLILSDRPFVLIRPTEPVTQC